MKAAGRGRYRNAGVTALAAAATLGGACGAAALWAQDTGVSAATPPVVTVRINGKPALSTRDRDGEVYIPVSALKQAGAEVTQVGDTLTIRFQPAAAEQGDRREGRPGEWVSNGIWRVRVSEVRPFGGAGASRSGVDLTVEVMNASGEARKVAPGLTSARLKCTDSAGTALAMGELAASGVDASLEQECPPGRQGTLTLRFFYPAGHAVPEGATPGKLTLQFDPAAAKFPVADPTLTILLTDAP